MRTLTKLIIAVFTSLIFVMCTDKSDDSSQKGNKHNIVKDSIAVHDEKHIGVCWPSYKEKEPNIDATPFDKMSHLIICFAYPNEDGTLNTSQIDSINELVYKCHENDIKAILNIGGAGSTSDHFPTISVDSVLRKRFVENVTRHTLS